MSPTLSSLSESGKSFIKNITDKNSYWTLPNVKFLRETRSPEVYNYLYFQSGLSRFRILIQFAVTDTCEQTAKRIVRILLSCFYRTHYNNKVFMKASNKLFHIIISLR